MSKAVSEIEVHKMTTGSYPDKLQEIKNRENLNFLITDTGFIETGYYYEKLSNGYILGNVGPNKIKGDSDDIVPILKDTVGLGIRNAKIGDAMNSMANRFRHKKP
jgi:hypothetical protein